MLIRFFMRGAVEKFVYGIIHSLEVIYLFTGVEQPILFGFAAIKVQLRMPCNFEPNPEDKDTPGSSMGTSVPSWRTL